MRLPAPPLALLVALVFSTAAPAQQSSRSMAMPPAVLVKNAPAASDAFALPDDPQPQSGVSAAKKNGPSNVQPGKAPTPSSGRQPKRILGIMPNYRAVSAGTIPEPPTPKQSFLMATDDSFDYSAFVFTGLTSLIAEGEDSHPKLGKGVGGFWGYTWRGYVDKTDGDYLVLFAFPTIFHQDERYYTLGRGSILKRAVYAASTVLIAPDYSGHKNLNVSELLGRGTAEAISTTYYPAQDRTFGTVATKYGYALMRDALTNTFREFWPDIAAHLLRQHPENSPGADVHSP